MTDGAVTDKLGQLRSGDPAAWPDIIRLVYGDLRRLAASQLRNESAGHTLQPTALVHEAYLRLRNHSPLWHDRAHFLAVASQLMRLILVDHARRAHRLKRNGGAQMDISVSHGDRPETIDVVALHEGLEKLALLSTRQSHVVELRFFGGLTFEEVSQVTGAPLRTVKRDWSTARAWLHAYLAGESIAL